MTVASLPAYLNACLLAAGLQLLWLLGPLLLFALLMQGCAQLIRNRAAATLGSGLYVWMTCPGIVLHELGHAFFCLLFGHRIVAIALFRPYGKGALGFVKHSYDRKNLYQTTGNFFIGTGPIWFGSLTLVACAYWLAGPEVLAPLALASKPALDPTTLDGLRAAVAPLGAALVEALRQLFDPTRLGDWRIYLFAYLVFALGSHVTLSLEDLKGAWQGLLVGALLLLGVNLATLWSGPWVTDAARLLVPYLVLTSAILLLVLALNFLLAMLMLLLPSARHN